MMAGSTRVVSSTVRPVARARLLLDLPATLSAASGVAVVTSARTTF